MMEYFLWHEDRATLLTTLASKVRPDNGRPILTLAEDGTYALDEDVLMSEVGSITKMPAVLDAEGNEVTPAVIVPGWHVNMVAKGSLAALLTAGLPQTAEDGSPLGLFERTRILQFLGETEWVPVTPEGVPAAYQGTSGTRIYDPATISRRANCWQ